MTPELQRCVAEYERQEAADAATADHSLLADGLAAFERLTADQRLAPPGMSEPRPSSSSNLGSEPKPSICSRSIWRKTWTPMTRRGRAGSAPTTWR